MPDSSLARSTAVGWCSQWPSASSNVPPALLLAKSPAQAPRFTAGSSRAAYTLEVEAGQAVQHSTEQDKELHLNSISKEWYRQPRPYLLCEHM